MGAVLGEVILCGYVSIVDPMPPVRALVGLFTVGASCGAVVGTVLAPIARRLSLENAPEPPVASDVGAP